MACGAVVARELGHGEAGVGVLVFNHLVGTRQDLSLDDVFRVGDGVLLHRLARHEPNRLFADGSGNSELVVAKRRGGRLEAGADLDGGVNADGDRDGKRLPQLGGALGHGADVTAARLQKDREFVLRLDAHAVNGHVGLSVSGCVA